MAMPNWWVRSHTNVKQDQIESRRAARDVELWIPDIGDQVGVLVRFDIGPAGDGVDLLNDRRDSVERGEEAQHGNVCFVSH